MLIILSFFLSWYLGGSPLGFPPQETTTSIQFNQQQGIVTVVGLEPDLLNVLKDTNLTTSNWQKLFPVYTGNYNPEAGDKPALLGTYAIEDHRLEFRPRFPLVPGLTYSAYFEVKLAYQQVGLASSGVSRRLQHIFSVAESSVAPTTTVSHIYPSTATIPENQLKFYIHFSAPMRRGDVYQYIHLIDADGNEVQTPFLELDPELWDPNGQRLTLFFDPGRIKRGLRPHLDLGMALQAGHRYRLIIDQAMPDAKGQPLKAAREKSFQVVTADRISPDYKNWHLSPPAGRTKEPLELIFPEPLEHALLSRMIKVEGLDGQAIYGMVEISNEETRWQFIPEGPWKAGTYTIRIDTALEDLAGNKLNRLFDVDIQNKNEYPSEVDTHILLPFKVQF